MARGATISIDGKSSVDQGDGYPHQSLGSKTIRCDLDEAINWFAMKRASESHLTPIPRDVDGVPHRLCSNGHYSPVAAFSKNPARDDGLDNYCRQCRAEIQRKWRVQEAEANGRKLREKAGRPAKFVNQTP